MLGRKNGKMVKCKRIRICTTTIGKIDELGLLPHVECLVDKKPCVIAKICEGEEIPAYVIDTCTCIDGSPYPQSYCKRRTKLLGDKRWLEVAPS